MQKTCLAAAFFSFTTFNPAGTSLILIAASVIAVLVPVGDARQFQQHHVCRGYQQTPFIFVNRFPACAFPVALRRSAGKVGRQRLTVMKEQLG